MTRLFALALVCVLACGNKDEQNKPSSTTSEGPIDACTLMPRDKLEAALGELSGGIHSVAVEPPLAGMCKQRLAGDMHASITLRSLTDYDAMADGATELAGLGERAHMAAGGVMLKLAGKPWFVHAVVTGPSGVDRSKSIELAKLVAAQAR